MFNTVTNVIPKDLLLQSTKCRTDCRDLRDDIDAVTVFLDHAREPTHLSLDSVQPLGGFRLDVLRASKFEQSCRQYLAGGLALVSGPLSGVRVANREKSPCNSVLQLRAE